MTYLLVTEADIITGNPYFPIIDPKTETVHDYLMIISGK